MKAHGGVEVQIHFFLTLALVEGGWSASRSGCFTPGKPPVPIKQEVGWAPEPWNMKKCKFLTLPGLEFRPLAIPNELPPPL
jgi:hypothetical protein